MQRKTAKPKKTFADIAAARKRYDPNVDGYGNPQEWTGAFHQRMGFEEAERVIHGQKQTPRQILGVAANAPWQDVVSAYRKAMLNNHPDRHELNGMTREAAEEASRQINAAYAVLAREYGK